MVKEPDVKGLGAMEGNVDKILASRMKKRGMSWTIDGAHNMAKIIEVRLSNPVDEILLSYQPKADESFKKAIDKAKLDFKQTKKRLVRRNASGI